jgi:hypothetical protein
MKNHLMKTGIFSLLIISALLFHGCLKDNEFKYETVQPGTLAFLDVADAAALVLGDAAQATGSSLYKITHSGELKQIRYYKVDTIITQTQNGITVELDSFDLSRHVHPIQVLDLTPSHFLISFNQPNPQSATESWEFNFVVRKSDGAVTNVQGYTPIHGKNPQYDHMFRNRQKLVQQDNQNNLYYLGRYTIHKLNLQNPADVSLQVLAPSPGEEATNFRVNGLGHLLVTNGGITTDRNIRFFIENVGFSEPDVDFLPYWTGPDNQFYYSVTTPEGYPQIGRVAFNNNNPVFQSVGVLNHPGLLNTNLNNGYYFNLTQLNKTVIIANPEGNQNELDRGAVVAEVFNSAQNPQAFSLSELGVTTVKDGVSSPRYYYLVGTSGVHSVLLKVDASTFPHTTTTLVAAGELDITHLSVSDQDVVYYHGLNRTTGVLVVGEISANGVKREYPGGPANIFQVVSLNQ